MSVCTLPPHGWRCSRAAGHEGPCATHPASPTAEWWARRWIEKATPDEIAAMRAIILDQCQCGARRAEHTLAAGQNVCPGSVRGVFRL